MAAALSGAPTAVSDRSSAIGSDTALTREALQNPRPLGEGGAQRRVRAASATLALTLALSHGLPWPATAEPA